MSKIILLYSLLLLCLNSQVTIANHVQVNLPFESAKSLGGDFDALVLQGKGRASSALPSNCAEIHEAGLRTSGVYTLQIGSQAVEVYCDLETDGGGWTIIQRRDDYPPPLDFYRDWMAYKLGFGELHREFWLGLQVIHKLLSKQPNVLRVDLEDFSGNKRFASYSHFHVATESNKYRLLITGYAGDAGDSLGPHNGMYFSTKDRDNDVEETQNCAVQYTGPWWHARCHESNLNGKYLRGNHSTFADGIEWKQWLGYNYSLKKTEMKIRPVDFHPYKMQ